MIFNTREKVKLSPTSSSEVPKVSPSKKPTIVPPIVPSVPSIPARNSLSQPSGKGQIEEIIKPSPDQEIEDLQLSQRPIIGPSEQAQPRRSKRIRLQQEKNLLSGPVTRSQARKDTGEYSSILAYEVDEDNHLETSGIILSQEKQEFDCDYLTISACVELVEEKCIECVFSTQDLVIPTNIDEALQNTTWKKSMDNEYKALTKFLELIMMRLMHWSANLPPYGLYAWLQHEMIG